ncbi:MAG: enoyl-CoA hydratase-related protein [Bacteroidia bacterium]|nr:enoyl-CoA hydratase-related protein [Bacteroidia bacterium]
MSEDLLLEKILVKTEGFVKTISLNNPKRKNAISNDMATRLKDEILKTKNEDSIRVIVLTGEGADFCAGADLDPRVVSNGKFSVTEFLRENYNVMIQEMRKMDKVFIAKVRGNCVGAAFNFALACDMIYASETSRFSQIFTRIGLSSDGGGAYFMPQKVGYHKAFELMALNKIITSSEAESLGLVNKILPDGELDSFVHEMAKSISEGPFIAIRNTKKNLYAGMTQGLAAGLDTEAVNQGENFVTKDFFEGIAAFLQKRKANFKGE